MTIEEFEKNINIAKDAQYPISANQLASLESLKEFVSKNTKLSIEYFKARGDLLRIVRTNWPDVGSAWKKDQDERNRQHNQPAGNA